MLVLDYRNPVPPRRWAGIIRWSMFAVSILAVLVAATLLLNPVFAISESLGGGTLGTPFAPINRSLIEDQSNTNQQNQINRRYLPQGLAYLAIFLLAQWGFLCPRGSLMIRAAPDGPPSRRSAMAAGFIGMLLSIGMLATLMELPNWWLRLTAGGEMKTVQHFTVVWIIMGLMWIGWTLVFLSYAKTLDRYTWTRKVFRWLLAGTVLELLVAAPAHALIVNERGNDCYCERGTWTGVAFGCTSAFWLFGPGTLLLFMREKRRRGNLV